MRRRGSAALVAAMVMLATAACTHEDSGDDSPGSAPATSASPSAEPRYDLRVTLVDGDVEATVRYLRPTADGDKPASFPTDDRLSLVVGDQIVGFGSTDGSMVAIVKDPIGITPTGTMTVRITQPGRTVDVPIALPGPVRITSPAAGEPVRSGQAWRLAVATPTEPAEVSAVFDPSCTDGVEVEVSDDAGPTRTFDVFAPPVIAPCDATLSVSASTGPVPLPDGLPGTSRAIVTVERMLTLQTP